MCSKSSGLKCGVHNPGQCEREVSITQTEVMLVVVLNLHVPMNPADGIPLCHFQGTHAVAILLAVFWPD
jgi:hypothetical protein